MYLHEAMEKLFRQVGRSMTTKEIAEKLNENKWYRKADGSLITPMGVKTKCTKEEQRQKDR